MLQPPPPAAARACRGLVGVRIQEGRRGGAADHESGGVDLPLVLVPENGGILDRIEEMGGIVLRANQHAGGLPFERFAEQTRQRVRDGRVDFGKGSEIRTSAASASAHFRGCCVGGGRRRCWCTDGGGVLRFRDDRMKGWFRLSIDVEEQRFAVGSPGVRVIGRPRM